MMAEPPCGRCFRILSPDDVVESDGVGVAHVDCRRPRDLTHEERSLLYGYCWAHPGGPGYGSACGVCDQALANHQLMMLIPCGATPISLHTDCFELWNEERHRFTSSA